ncbi:Alpha amylase, catalytic domain containing protein [Trichomonas vaginalis G3]|uniref:Alpha amylase, catalytic domain containing protein n=3 Tax=Trichomonas vaginalis (strain ATCC PRA-98 / G3) TaxID=412133 RepID=A2G0M2_TRIV3|nr:maltodextrin glucosidase family [Trichomonas vaginalis G3]EAX89294.1 Alpha amylase, catalytic domain containing protein [Trichomonas vaginalis G3]KAI5514736.1 maltodextrin glucosidase family [Trichomonas vaginalis G3]|eukprot:XP_001302224.1 Alpha amylase, catalytic domain containing protein [Trichomonas vaginalis G3]
MIGILSILSCLARSEDFNNIRMYQVMVSSFQDGDGSRGYGTGYGPSSHRGDLRGIINALPYIKGLNVNALWMTPIFDSSYGQGGSMLQSTGYFATNYFNIDPNFGDEGTFRELVNKAHELGLYVILDGVFGHHGGVRSASPSGRWPQGGSNPVSYPGSLDFYKEVATYWIEKYGIDGWRLDQCYQMYQNGHNYMSEIRQAIEDCCNQRRNRGDKWGTLGYIVGEHWSGAGDINTRTYGQNGLRSAFDFPSRYNLVQSIAMEESGAGGYPVENLGNIFKTPSEKGYSGQVYPNLFITNHDVWRFGNLIRSKYGYARENDAYWNRHKIAIGILAAYTGPITIYYGDEYGDIAECWYGQGGSCGGNTYSDNAARTNGRTGGFNSREQDLHDFTAKVMRIRSENPSLWRGSNGKTFNNGCIFNCKYDSQTGNKVVFAANLAYNSVTTHYQVGGSRLTDLISGRTYTSSNGAYDIQLNGLGVALFKVE